MNKLIFFLFFAFTSCSTFSKYSPYNKVESCVDGYYCMVNDSLQLKYESLGGFHYANNLKEYRKMKIKNKPKFKNIIVYGKSNILETDYYLILNNKIYPKNFYFKDTIINKQKITIALNSNRNGTYNKNFLLNFKLPKL